MSPREKDIRERARILQESVDWWTVQANDLFCEIDEIHDKAYAGKTTEKDEQRVEVLYAQLETLINRGRMETENTFKLEEEIKEITDG